MAYTATQRGLTIGRGTAYPWRTMPAGHGVEARQRLVPDLLGGARTLDADVTEVAELVFDVWLRAPTAAGVQALRDALAAAWAPSGDNAIEELKVEFASGVRVFRGRPLSAEILLDRLATGPSAVALLRFTVMDPTWYSAVVDSVGVTAPGDPGGVEVAAEGVTVEADGVTVSGGSASGDAFVFNSGTKDAHWRATLHGPLTVPRLLLGGKAVQIDAIIPAGSVAVVDSRTRSVTFDGAPRPWVSFNSTWWLIPPDGSMFSLRSVGGGADTGTATLTWQNASH